ncbi:hypothetical protein LEMLEM_LOCUS6070 [Lemmus lemmus]
MGFPVHLVLRQACCNGDHDIKLQLIKMQSVESSPKEYNNCNTTAPKEHNNCNNTTAPKNITATRLHLKNITATTRLHLRI